MTIDALVFEIGSTTTMANAFDKLDANPVFLGQGMAKTTVENGDVTIGLNQAMKTLKEKLGVKVLNAKKTYATSSAAGGLKMSVHGLVYDMTVKAAKEAALGAGANLRMITAGLLDEDQLGTLSSSSVNIIMIAGGVDHGEKKTALLNAESIAALQLDIPVIYAGNIENRPAIKRIFEKHDQSDHLYITDNVYPKIDILDVSEARTIIQNVFEKHIVRAPGMEKVRDIVSEAIIPTPGAVMEASKILYGVYGDLITLDVGGATTDVHSVTSGNKKIQDMLLAPEPFEKRTVEGDLGVFVNKDNIVNLWTKQRLTQSLKWTSDRLKTTLDDYKEIPDSRQLPLVRELAFMALKIAVERHAGTYISMFGPTGRTTYAEGKDLTEINVAVGTGGVLSRLENSVSIIKEAFEGIAKDRLIPTKPVRSLVDRDYIMASAGVLHKDHPKAAQTLLLQSLARR